MFNFEIVDGMVDYFLPINWVKIYHVNIDTSGVICNQLSQIHILCSVCLDIQTPH